MLQFARAWTRFFELESPYDNFLKPKMLCYKKVEHIKNFIRVKIRFRGEFPPKNNFQ